ncbi:ABC transporter ATP-binding protein [Marinobacteraceae bacterium S3BR75-40.1]
MSILQLEAVDYRYYQDPVLQQIDFTLQEGEVVGLFGHNGAGKTTTIKLILGLLRPTQGKLRVLGQDPDVNDVRRHVGYLPENVQFYPQLTGYETLRYFARLKRVERAQVDRLLDRVGLEAARYQRIKTYSKGMRQRLGLAQALLGRPRLLMLDEPTVGLDPIATRALYDLIDELRADGTSVILCSHVLPGVEPHIDRAAILAKGRLQACGTLAELRSQTRLPTEIRVHGIDDPTPWLTPDEWRIDDVRALNGDGYAIRVAPEHKLSVLRRLLSESTLTDVDVQQPTLEDLYRHYMPEGPVAKQGSLS